MRLRVQTKDYLPPANVIAGAAARGIEVLVIAHLRAKNAQTKPNRYGLPKSNYYAEASSNVASSYTMNKATVEVDYPGISVHYEGGTILPKKKALAVPIDPSVAGIWPSEVTAKGDDHYTMFWPKNSSHGFIKDADTSALLWMLIPKATIRADETVLPNDREIYAAAETAIQEALS